MRKAYISIFILLCMLPSLLLICGVKNKNYENRPLAKMPSIIKNDGLNLDFPEEFDSYFSDNFALREQMVTALNLITVNTLSDTLNEKTVIGKNDFIFYAETLDDYMGTNVLDDNSIEAATKTLMLLQETALANGKKFLFTVAPNKNSIYPEYMSDRFAVYSNDNNLSKLEKSLKQYGVNYLDLKSLLTENKCERELYYRHDTHWNDYGALIGYRAIMSKIADGYSYEDYLDAKYKSVYDYSGDIHYFIFPSSKGSYERVEYDVDLVYKQDGSGLGSRITEDTKSDKNDLKILFFHDSFYEALKPYMSSNVGRILYSAEFPYNYSHLYKEDFDVVLIELVERNIDLLVEKAPQVEAPQRNIDGIDKKMIYHDDKCEFEINKNVVSGKLTASFSPANDMIIVKSGNKEYEAFPLKDGGFSCTLPDGAELDSDKIEIFIVKN